MRTLSLADLLGHRRDLEVELSPSASSTSSGSWPPEAFGRDREVDRGVSAMMVVHGYPPRAPARPLPDSLCRSRCEPRCGSAMNAASSFTQPISAEPRVCCHVSPRKKRPGTSVTPRRWRSRPSASKTGSVDPRVVGAVAGRPDDRVDLELAAVVERDRAPGRLHCARSQPDAVAAPELSRARADQRLPAPQLAPEPRFDRRPEQARHRQPPEQIAPEEALRQRRLARADGEVRPRGVPASSLAIWKPVFPPPTTSTVPVGTSPGRR